MNLFIFIVFSFVADKASGADLIRISLNNKVIRSPLKGAARNQRQASSKHTIIVRNQTMTVVLLNSTIDYTLWIRNSTCYYLAVTHSYPPPNNIPANRSFVFFLHSSGEDSQRQYSISEFQLLHKDTTFRVLKANVFLMTFSFSFSIGFFETDYDATDVRTIELGFTVKLSSETRQSSSEASSLIQLLGDDNSQFARADSFSRLIQLRDKVTNSTNATLNKRKPLGGWYFTPIHANLIGMTGQVLLTGWNRPEQYNCGYGGTRQLGASFLFDFVSISKNNQTVLEIDPIDERPLQVDDVLYCAGHTIISTADRRGMVLFTGGSRYENIGTRRQKEFGIDYARMFEPAKGRGMFVPIHFKMPFGSSWYPTNTLLPDGMTILVTAGFFGYKYLDPSLDNNGIALFRLDRYLAGLNPWQLLFDHNHSHPLIAPSSYTHVYVLLRPVVRDGIIYTIALFGRAGRILLLSIDKKDPSKSKWYLPMNGARPNKRQEDQSTSTLLESGDILIYGDSQISPWLDVYRPSTDSWRSLNTFSRRTCVTSVLLPDGSVLLIHGENLNHNRGLSFMNDARFMQIYYPDSHSIETLSNTIEPFEQERHETGGYREYHSFAILLADGRILLGGGMHVRGRMGCEQPNLRVFSPPYLFRGKRPVITAVQFFDESGLRVIRNDTLAYSNGFLLVQLASVAIQNVSSAVLLAVGSTTHGVAQNQRIIRLIRIHCGGKSLLFRIPSPPVIIPGDYLLFVLTNSGVPSVGYYLTVLQSQTHQATRQNDDFCTHITNIPMISTPLETHISERDLLFYLIVVTVLIPFCICCNWIRGKRFQENSL